MKTPLVAVFILLAALAGCATPSTAFVSQDGKVTRCAAHGWGYVGAPMAQGIHDKCTADVRAAGLIPLAEAGGIGIMPSTDSSSLRILKVAPGSPADLAGIKAGDVLVAIDGQPVMNMADARRLTFGRVNTPVKVTYRAGDMERTVNLIRSPITSVQNFS